MDMSEKRLNLNKKFLILRREKIGQNLNTFHVDAE